MNTVPNPDTEARRRHQRWVIIALVILAGLVIYGAGLGWVAQRLQDDLVSTIRPLPAAEDHQHRSD